MAKKEAPIAQLQSYLPAGTYDAVLHYLQLYHVHLTVAQERKSILGDYRHRIHDKNHRISVNGNLNCYSFLITLLHELAHLLTFERYGNKVQSHGKEWKQLFGELLSQFVNHAVFPDDIRTTLLQSLQNPAASSCADAALLRVLKKYDKDDGKKMMVEQLAAEVLFKTSDGRVFKKMDKVRKRYKCIEIASGRLYLFSPVYEVEPV